MSNFLNGYLANLLFTDRRSRDGFAAGIAAVNRRNHGKKGWPVRTAFLSGIFGRRWRLGIHLHPGSPPGPPALPALKMAGPPLFPNVT
jgi:hypothetical protein